MFIYETHLPQILPRESYTSDDQHQQEMEQLYQPSWHFVGTIGDLPNDGDYLTTTLFDRPLILWNRGGRIQAFVNVCPEGCSELANEPKGNADRLVCETHAAVESAELETVRVEFCGALVFVNFDEDAPDLETFVGPMWDTMRGLFPEDVRDVLSLDYEIEANWKVKVENTLESYHVSMVHANSFSHMPEAEVCQEQLGENCSTFNALEEAPTRIDRVLDRIVHRIAGAERDLNYSHHIVFPHVMFAKMRMLCWIETVFPISPSRHRVVLRSFYRPTEAGGFRSGLGYHLMRTWARKFGTTVSAEDAAIIPSVQKGLASPAAPSAGLLSIREERLFHFQEYIKRETNPPGTAEHVLEPTEPVESLA